MRTTLLLVPALGLLLGCGGGADDTADRAAGAADQRLTDTMVSASTETRDTATDGGLTWAPAPPGLPAGAQVAVVSGDPTKAGAFTIRVDMPSDYAVRPHHHPTSEKLRLLEGTLHLGHGAKWNEQGMKAMATGQPVTLGVKEPHFLHAATRVVMEVQSTGPFAITYVDPKEDPRSTSKP
ncbi:MAG: cupin domain-containing protein [Gemmatimonadales bacterium]|nr:cupin domain-containing protein [Gemmatimonadales bacterium]